MAYVEVVEALDGDQFFWNSSLVENEPLPWSKSTDGYCADATETKIEMLGIQLVQILTHTYLELKYLTVAPLQELHMTSNCASTFHGFFCLILCDRVGYHSADFYLDLATYS